MIGRSHTSLIIACACAVALIAVSIGLAVGAGWSLSRYVDTYTLTNMVVGASLALSGGVIAWYRPRNAVGILLIVGGLGHLVSAGLAPIGAFGISAGWPDLLVRVLVAVYLGAWTLGLPTLFMLALLLFPDGSLPSRRWRWAAWFIVAATAWSVVSSVLSPVALIPDEPASRSIFAWSGMPLDAIDLLNTAVGIVPVAIVVASLIVRYVRGGERMRRQLLWLMLAVFAMVLVNIQRWITGNGPILLLLSAALIPVAIAIAIVRYRLLDIRVVLSRTLVYAVTIVVVVAVYAAIVATLTLVLPADTDRAIAIAAAVLVALVFNPVRLVTQRTIGRAFFGTRDDPVQTAARAHAAEDLSGVLAGLRRDLRLPRLEVVAPDGAVTVSDDGADEEAVSTTLPLTGDLGELRVWLRSGERRLHAADRGALQLVIPAISAVVRERALADSLRRARAQTADARERERQRLHRELHDGLGPVLTGAAMRMDAAAGLLDEDPRRARSALMQARVEVGEALTDVRRVVYGLRPIALDEKGLLGALREEACRVAPPRVDLVADEPLPQLNPAVELAAYRVAVEAIANARRHSSGTLVRVAVTASPTELMVTVVDDGGRADGFHEGVGIASIRERVDELDGTAEIGPVDSGWRVAVRLPLTARVSIGGRGAIHEPPSGSGALRRPLA